MLKWIRDRLKWWIAGDELAEVERWRIRCAEYDRWLASYPDIALVLQNLRAMAGGAGCTSNIAVDVPWLGPDAGPWDINGLRVHVARIRASAGVMGSDGAKDASDREERAARYIRESGKEVHSSDCATSQAPAFEPGPCDCNEPQPAGVREKSNG